MDEGAVLQSKKRRRAGSNAQTRKRRREQQGGPIYQLNFDVLRIIFTYVYPMDLLNLARTCKSFRGILMHEYSIWRTSLRQIEGLPECPPDLSPPEYTNLVFGISCHGGCGKSVKNILWNTRRRYCEPCGMERLCNLDSCGEIIRESNVLPNDKGLLGNLEGHWVDKDHLDSFMRKYRNSDDKTKFMNEKKEQYQKICSHARECELWQQLKGRVHRYDLDVLRKERQEDIFERLRQRGYQPEIAFFPTSFIKGYCRPAFRNTKPITWSEWDRMLPKWVEIMDRIRLLRVEIAVHRPRRFILVVEYNEYVKGPSPDSRTFDFLPHVDDVARFPPFRDIIRAPEEIQVDEKSFDRAFSRLPELVDDWMQKLNSEISALVIIPPNLSLENVSGDRYKASKMEVHETTLDKLRLACAVFSVNETDAFAYPEVLSVSMRYNVQFEFLGPYTARGVGVGKLKSLRCEDHSDRTGSTYDRFGLRFLEEAPYIVLACGLDPNVATVYDMDRRNARLTCLCCGGRMLVMTWRHAIWHARFYHCIAFLIPPLSEAPRWQLVGDQHMDAIQAVERSSPKMFTPNLARCLLCRPRVGDAMLSVDVRTHLGLCHGLGRDEIKEGVHCKLLGTREACVVEMVRAGGRETFRVLEE